MNIKKAINSKTLLIPSLFLNVALLIAVAHFGRQLGDILTEMTATPSVAWSAKAMSEQRDTAAPVVSADASVVPSSGAR